MRVFVFYYSVNCQTNIVNFYKSLAFLKLITKIFEKKRECDKRFFLQLKGQSHFFEVKFNIKCEYCPETSKKAVSNHVLIVKVWWEKFIDCIFLLIFVRITLCKRGVKNIVVLFLALFFHLIKPIFSLIPSLLKVLSELANLIDEFLALSVWFVLNGKLVLKRFSGNGFVGNQIN